MKTQNARDPGAGSSPGRGAGTESYTWRFEDPNRPPPNNLWLIVTLQNCGGMMLANEVIPLADGGFIHAIKYTQYQALMKNQYVMTMKSKHTNFGVVSISRMEVNEYYEGITRTIFKTNFKVFRVDTDGNRTEITNTQSYRFPPLPVSDRPERDVPPRDRSEQSGTHGGCIYFPLVEPVSPDEFEAGEGVLLEGSPPASAHGDAGLQSNPEPGIYVEFTEQGGNPSLLVTLFWMMTAEGTARYLFGNYCTDYSYYTYKQSVVVKKSGSWFREKKKITLRREELKIEGVNYYDI